MSRSRKKVPMIKDSGGGKSYAKRLSHHRERASVGTLLQHAEVNDDVIFPEHRPHTLINQYDVCDWKWSPIYNNSWQLVSDTAEERDKFSRK